MPNKHDVNVNCNLCVSYYDSYSKTVSETIGTLTTLKLYIYTSNWTNKAYVSSPVNWMSKVYILDFYGG